MHDAPLGARWLPLVKLPGDDRQYGGALLMPDGPVIALAVLVHGIAGDVGGSAYFSRFAESFRDAGAAVLFLRADGFCAADVELRVVDHRGDVEAFIEIVDRTLAAAADVEPALAGVPLVMVPHSLAVAKTVAYASNFEAVNRERLRGIVALSPVNVQPRFARPAIGHLVARALTAVGLGGLRITPATMRRLGSASIDWGVTIGTVAALGTKGGPLDLVDITSASWMRALDRRLDLAQGAKQIVIGEIDELHGRTDEHRRASVRSLATLVERQTDWTITVVDNANHSFQTRGAARDDDSALLLSREAIDEVVATVTSAVVALS